MLVIFEASVDCAFYHSKKDLNIGIIDCGLYPIKLNFIDNGDHGNGVFSAPPIMFESFLGLCNFEFNPNLIGNLHAYPVGGMPFNHRIDRREYKWFDSLVSPNFTFFGDTLQPSEPHYWSSSRFDNFSDFYIDPSTDPKILEQFKKDHHATL